MGRLGYLKQLDMPEEDMQIAIDYLFNRVTSIDIALKYGLMNPSNVSSWVTPRLRQAALRGMLKEVGTRGYDKNSCQS